MASAWTFEAGKLYLHGIEVPMVKSVQIQPPGREEVRDLQPDGREIIRPGRKIPGEIFLTLIDMPDTGPPVLHQDIRDHVYEDLMARILKLEEENARLKKALEAE